MGGEEHLVVSFNHMTKRGVSEGPGNMTKRTEKHLEHGVKSKGCHCFYITDCSY